ncbi:hypothetical protein L3Y34_002229 [Caenorhabditis briggsae]|uniref:Uncharacterized protein n=3 Tax=Caenorhabditis briggsae TaxID=6238 RepID=A0AAE9DEU3_CAEBR|nr:hypothetical protein L3Y34_002229 [Caenorhabditis briggsae]
MSFCTFLARIAVFFLNLAQLLVALTVIALTLWIRFDKSFESEIRTNILRDTDPETLAGVKSDIRTGILVAFWIIIGFSIANVVIGFVGVIGAVIRSRYLLAPYLLSMIILFLLEIAVGITALVKRKSVRRTVKEYVFDAYNMNAQPDIAAFNFRYNCCGAENLPNVECFAGQPTCSSAVWDSLDFTMMIFGIVMLCIVVLQAFTALITVPIIIERKREMQEEEVPANENASDDALRIGEEPIHEDMEIEDERQEEEEAPAEAAPQVAAEDESVEKSKIQKDAFMEMFRKAPRIKDILPDLREFMEHPDVIEWDRREVEHLVELRIQEEKAKRKAEKAKEKQQQQTVVPPVFSADSLQSAVGFDLAGILQKIKPLTQPLVVPIAQPVSDDQPLSSELVSSVRVLPPTPTINPSQVECGRAGFDTPHPNVAPADLRNVKPEMIAPIPDELRVLPDHNRVMPIPNELLPPDQQVPEQTPIVFVRPPLRKTLFLAGARAGKRAERLKKDEKQGESNRKKKKRLLEEAREQANQENSRAGGFPRRRGFIELTGMNALPAGLNKNSPVSVKRYHARQLAKETGMSVEEAMKEIEEQCNEFGCEDTPEAREHDERAMELIKKRGEERWNQRYNYTPADHSKGIPGVDRPPAGHPPSKRATTTEKSRHRDEESIPAVNRPPVGYNREPVPGVDRPPAGDRPDRSREPIPGVDRPPIGDRGYRREDFREPIPGIDRPPGEKRRSRGGVKEREKKRKREEFRERGRGGRGGRGGGRGGFDRGGGYGREPKAGRYDDYSRDQYSSYQGGGYDGYDDRGGYDDYYGRHEGYDSYNQYGGYGTQEGENGYGYDQQGADAYYQQGYEGQEAATSSYYQEDGSQYYNEYYGTSDQQGAEGGGQQEYHATFGEPSTSSSANQPPAA